MGAASLEWPRWDRRATAVRICGQSCAPQDTTVPKGARSWHGERGVRRTGTLDSGVLDLQSLQDLVQRLRAYSTAEVAVELALIWIVVYLIVRFVQGTRAAGALKGLFVVLVLGTIASRFAGASSFQRLGFLYDRFLALVAVSLIVIFQPELRRALIRLGEAGFLRGTPKEIAFVTGELADACKYLSRAKFGALIVLERQVGLAGVVEGGTPLNAELSARLLQTIFFPGSALHDLAVVVKGRVVRAAAVQLPLAEPAEMPDPSLGSRHRAAVGVSKECDALVVVVSEETGAIRIAERGRLSTPMSPEELEKELTRRLSRVTPRRGRAGPDTHAAEPPLEPAPSEPAMSAEEAANSASGAPLTAGEIAEARDSAEARNA
ncbi:MAG: TIGR00159 family protein [Phycisphaerae bacterium]|nr:TIGR00159 family protein [Phycisphaerae bacterium]